MSWMDGIFCFSNEAFIYNQLYLMNLQSTMTKDKGYSGSRVHSRGKGHSGWRGHSSSRCHGGGRDHSGGKRPLYKDLDAPKSSKWPSLSDSMIR
jgi:hypothetical protein